MPILGNSEQPAVTSSASVDDEGGSDRARPGYPPSPLGGGSGSSVVRALASFAQALVKLQLRFSIPNAHERTRASFSSIVRSRISATRTKKSTGIWRVLPAMRFSKRRGL
jgi:hypothetical protein